MAVVAFASAAAVVSIVTGVAAVTGCRRFEEGLVGVTIKTGCLLVLSCQAESGYVMVEFDLGPADRRVAVATCSTHCFPVHVVCLVTGRAFGLRITMLFAGLVTGTTVSIAVFSFQREVSGHVRE